MLVAWILAYYVIRKNFLNYDTSDTVKHLRAVHFTLIIICLTVTFSTAYNYKEIINKAIEQLNALQSLSINRDEGVGHAFRTEMSKLSEQVSVEGRPAYFDGSIQVQPGDGYEDTFEFYYPNISGKVISDYKFKVSKNKQKLSLLQLKREWNHMHNRNIYRLKKACYSLLGLGSQKIRAPTGRSIMLRPEAEKIFDFLFRPIDNKKLISKIENNLKGSFSEIHREIILESDNKYESELYVFYSPLEKLKNIDIKNSSYFDEIIYSKPSNIHDLKVFLVGTRFPEAVSYILRPEITGKDPVIFLGVKHDIEFPQKIGFVSSPMESWGLLYTAEVVKERNPLQFFLSYRKSSLKPVSFENMFSELNRATTGFQDLPHD